MNFPNFLTTLRILLTPIFFYFYGSAEPIDKVWGIFIFFFASFTDWYDGYYARKHGIVTRVGQFLDPLADKILVLTATFMFAFNGYVYWWIAWAIAIRDILVTLFRLFALYINKPVITSVVAKWKTAVQMVVVFAVMAQELLNQVPLTMVTFDLYASYDTLFGMGWFITALMSIYTCAGYFYENRGHLVQLTRMVFKLLRIH